MLCIYASASCVYIPSDVQLIWAVKLPSTVALRGNTFSMGCWFLICFVINYPNQQALSCVYVNNSPAAVESTIVY